VLHDAYYFVKITAETAGVSSTFLCCVFAGDHVLLESQDFACVFNPKQITIRTRASEKESYDSAPVTLTPELLAEIRYRVRDHSLNVALVLYS